ncbi:MAG: helix-turn-helix transcriptional regulator, partial [Sedimentisphaerales bacterium]|nr:helix-turn-helix transcriptional regulator [Sedimentisphaerales bacterium]
YEQRSRILKAMGHPTRLFIVEELGRQIRCVCELTAMVQADISTVSKHLAVLKQAGIVQDEKRGTQVFYSLRCPCVMQFFSCVETVLQNNARRQMDMAYPAPPAANPDHHRTTQGVNPKT